MKLKEILDAEPSNGKARYLLVQSLIFKKEPENAFQMAEEGVRLTPEDAYSYAALGDASFRLGEFGQAALSYSRARSLRPELARAHLGYGNVTLSVGNRRTAKESFKKAYELDPEDTDIIKAWATVLPTSPEELVLWDRVSREATHLDPEYLEDVKAFVEFSKKKGVIQYEILKQSPPVLQIPLGIERTPQGATTGWQIEVQINGGRKRRMLLDTGASGIIMTARDGKKDGVEVVAQTGIGGVGDEGRRRASLGFADTVTIGGVTLGNCLIKLGQQKEWRSSEDGILGTDVLHDFRITIDPERAVLSLEKLPEQSDAFCCDATDDTGGEFVKMHLIASKILVPGILSDRLHANFMIDTGAQESLIDDQAAEAVTKRDSTRLGLRGISGKVKDVREARNITLQFAGVRQQHPGMLSMDLANLSHQLGTEVTALIGCRSLNRAVITIDYRNALLKIVPAE